MKMVLMEEVDRKSEGGKQRQRKNRNIKVRKRQKKEELIRKKKTGSGSMVTVLAFYPDYPSSNPAVFFKKELKSKFRSMFWDKDSKT